MMPASIPTRDLYVSLRDNGWTCRKTLVEWYIKNLNQPFTADADGFHSLSDQGIEVVGAVPKTKVEQNEVTPHPLYHLDSDSKILLLSSSYKFVFGLDLSASVLRVDTLQPCAVLESLFLNLENCLWSLIQDFSEPEANLELCPKIYVSIFAQWHATSFKNANISGRHVQHKFLIHCCLLTKSSVKGLISEVREFIYNIKNTFAKEVVNPVNCYQQDILVELLKTGLSNFKHQKVNSRFNLVIISDGVVGMPDALALDKLVVDYHRHGILCFFVHVVTSDNDLCDFGCIPNVELMKYVAATTKGAYIESYDSLTSPIHSTSLQRTFLVKLLHNNLNLDASNPPLLRRKFQLERSVDLSFSMLLRCRMVEGYQLQYASQEDDTVFVVLERLWWSNFTIIEYKIISESWPLPGPCRVEVYMRGTYEFIHDMLYGKKNTWTTSRKMVYQKFFQFIKDLPQGEHMFIYLSTFTTNQSRFLVPESLRKGQALFYQAHHSDPFVLSMPPKEVNTEFSSFWKLVLNLDVDLLHRWFHVHSVELILQPDIVSMTGFYTSNSDAQYNAITCNVSFNALTSMLRSLSDFILLHDQAFLKIIPSKKEGPDEQVDRESGDSDLDTPSSFMLLRLIDRHPLIVVKIAFLLGIDIKQRQQIVSDLVTKLNDISSPPTLNNVTTITRVRHPSSKSTNNSSTSARNSVNSSSLGIILQKPINDVLIRYDCCPGNLMTLNYLNDSEQSLRNFLNRYNKRTKNESCFYMYHKRCVWSIDDIGYAKTLAELLLRVRQGEGYHITFSSSGIQNMVCEIANSQLNKEDCGPKCCKCRYGSRHIQYIIFPPVIKDIESSFCASESEDDDADSVKFSAAVKKSPENLLAAEICLDPQEMLFDDEHMKYPMDECLCKNLRSQYYNTVDMQRMADNIFAFDTICLSAVQTLETLKSMCASVDKEITLPTNCRLPVFSQNPVDGSPLLDGVLSFNVDDYDDVSDDGDELCEPNIVYYPTIFNFEGLLKNSSRVKMQFSLLEQENMAEASGLNDIVITSFNTSLKQHFDCEIVLNDAESNKITDVIFSRYCRAPLSSSKQAKSSKENMIKWKCYLKKGTELQTMVLFVPSTYQDFLNFLALSSDCKSSEDCKKTSSASVFAKATTTPGDSFPPYSDPNGASLRVKRRISVKRFSVTESKTNGEMKDELFYDENRTLSAFLFNCSMNKLVNAVLRNQCGFVRQDGVEWSETIEDLRINASDVFIGNHESCSPKKSFSASSEVHDSTASPFFSPEQVYSDDVFPEKMKEKDTLNEMCGNVRDLFYRSFVSGVFTAVRSAGKIKVSNDDVEITTDFMCQEFVDEIDITEFLLYNCPQTVLFKAAHLKQSQPPEKLNIVEEALKPRGSIIKPGKSILRSEVDTDEEMPVVSPQLDNSATDQSATPTPTTTSTGGKMLSFQSGGSAFMSFERASSTDNKSVDMTTTSASDSNDNPVEQKAKSSRRNKMTMKPVGANSGVSDLCDSATTHQQCILTNGWDNLPEFSMSQLRSRSMSAASECVSRHFDNTINSFCSPVHSMPDLFYATSGQTSSGNENDSMLMVMSNLDSEPECDFGTDKDNGHDLQLFNSQHMSTYAKPSVSSSNECEFSSLDVYQNDMPLFLYMVCTVRDKKTGNHGSMPVSSLPTSLKTILKSFEKRCDTVDLSSLQITLDLIWIYVPDYEVMQSERPPAGCQYHIEKTRKTIKWLVEDELISTLSRCEPLSGGILEKITDHVKRSKSNNCHVARVPLRFIFGADKSRDLFAKEFEALRIADYRLRKVDGCYYWKYDLTFLPIKSISAVGSTDELTNVDKPAAIKLRNHHSKSFQNLSCANFANIAKISVPEIEADLSEAPSVSDLTLAMNNSDEKLPLHLARVKHKSAADHYEDGSRYLSSPVSQQDGSGTHASSRHHSSSSKSRRSRSRRDTSASVPVTPTDLTSAGAHTIFSFEQPPVQHSQPRNKNVVVGHYALSKVLYNDTTMSPISADSPSDVQRQMSCTSWLGSGYDGEGESDDEEGALSINCRCWQTCSGHFQDFLIMMRVKDDACILYLHSRASSNNSKNFLVESKRVFSQIKSNIRAACKSVNQVLLLTELNDTRKCQPLLVEEPTEQIWEKPSNDSNNRLAASLLFLPGHFACQCRLKHVINLHHKLIDGHNGTTVPVAMTTIRAHLKSFSVLNQKDMFVFKVDDDNVFYCKIAVNFRLHDGRRSSVFFIDNDEADGVATTTPTHRSTPSSAAAIAAQLKSNRKCQVHIHWYGVHEISGKNGEFIDDLKCSIQRKLEEVALDHLMIMLSRNPMFKLAPPDIDLIQPRKFDPSGKYMTLEPPTDKIIFSLPRQLVNSDMYSQFVYYLHQHIFQFLIAPRYTDSSSKSGQFLPYTELHGHHRHNVATPPVPAPARKIYLYNAFSVASGRGGQGIACVSTDVLVSSTTSGSNSPANHPDFWKDGEVLAQSVVVDKTVVDDPETFPELEAIKSHPIARFCIWRHGSMQIENLVQKLELALQHGLCDLIIEKFLCMPIKVTTLGPQPIRNFSMRNICEEYETSKHLVAPPSMPPPSPVKEKQQECVLNEVYHTLLPEWVTKVIDIFKSPSACSTKMECSCFTVMYSLIAPVMEELERTVPDVNVVCYTNSGGGKMWKILNDLTVDEREERDQSACYTVIALGRRARIGQGFHTARISSFQKFVPHDPSLQRDSSPCPHDLVVKEYISRRNLVMVRFRANDMTVLMYNIAADKSNKLVKTLTEIVEFKENRHKFLQSLTFQKLGLFKAVPPLGKLTDGNKQPLSCRALIEDKRHARENNAHKIRAMMEDVYMNDQPTPITKHVVVETGDQLKMFGEQALAMNRRRRQLLEDLFHTQKFVLNSKCCGTSPSFKFSLKSFAIIFSYARLIYTVSCPILVSKALGGKDSAEASIPHESKPSRFLSKKSSTGEKLLVGKSDARPSRKEIIASTLTFIKEELFRIYRYTWKDFKHIIFLSSSIHDVEAVPIKSDSTQSPAYFYRVMPDAVLILTIELEEEKCVAKLYIIEVPQHADRRVRHDINFIIHCCDLARSSGFQTLCFDLHINLLRKQLASPDRTLMGHVLKNMLRHSEVNYSRLVDTTQRLQQMKIRHQVRSGVVKGRALYQFLVRNATPFGFGVVEGYDPSNSLLFTLSSLKAKEHLEECTIPTHEKHDINILLSKDHTCGCDDGKELCFIMHVIFTERKADGDEFHRSGSDMMDRMQSEMGMPFRRIQASLDISCGRRKPVDIRNDEERKTEANAIRKCEMQRTRSEVVKLMAKVENECERAHLYNAMMTLARDRSTIQNNSIKAELRRLIEVSRVSSASTFDPSIDSLISEVKFDRDRFFKRFAKFAHFYVVNDNLGKRICVFPQQQAAVTSSAVVHADVMILIQVNLANAVTTFNVVWPSKDSYVSDVELCRKVAHSLLQQILNEFFNLALLQRLL